jgi:hypothetical protein
MEWVGESDGRVRHIRGRKHVLHRFQAGLFQRQPHKFAAALDAGPLEKFDHGYRQAFNPTWPYWRLKNFLALTLCAALPYDLTCSRFSKPRSLPGAPMRC